MILNTISWSEGMVCRREEDMDMDTPVEVLVSLTLGGSVELILSVVLFCYPAPRTW